MGSRGALAKPDDQRQGRNKPLQVPTRDKNLPLIPDPPKGVKQEVKDLWTRLWQTPVGRAWDPDMDGPLLLRYAKTFHHWLNAQRDLANLDGVVTQGSQGQPVIHPITQYISQLEQRMAQMEDKLGLSPMARARLGLTIAEGELTAAQLSDMVKNRRRKET